jgi:cell division protease FtsH
VLVVAATNRPEKLDAALVRPGRFDRVVHVGLPNRTQRGAILEVHAKKRPMAEGVTLAGVARATLGFSGAQLESIVNEAAIAAARDGATQVRGLRSGLG